MATVRLKGGDFFHKRFWCPVYLADLRKEGKSAVPVENKFRRQWQAIDSAAVSANGRWRFF
jgi:hypothetical protein